jgi:general secretion pathway protein G
MRQILRFFPFICMLLLFITTASAIDSFKLQCKFPLQREQVFQSEVVSQTTLPTGSIITTTDKRQIVSICVRTDSDDTMTVVNMAYINSPEMKMEKATPGELEDFEKNKKSMIDELEKDQPPLKRQIATICLRPDGTIISIFNSPMSGSSGIEMQPLGNIQVPLLSETPISVGESWTKEFPYAMSKGTLIGFEDVLGYRCAKIQIENKFKNPLNGMTNEATYFIDTKQNQLVKSVSKYVVAGINTVILQTVELLKQNKLSLDKFKKVQQEFTELETGFGYINKQDNNSAKETFQKFIKAHPKSRFNEAVKGVTAEIDFIEQEKQKKQNQPKPTKVKMDILQLGAALDMYAADNGQYPTTEQGLQALIKMPSTPPEPKNWNGPYTSPSDFKDPWGNPYIYVCPSTHEGYDFDLYSHGSDGKEGGTDSAADITNWNMYNDPKN